MAVTAKARFVRITPRKFRQIIPLIKGRAPEEAIAILLNVKKRASQYAVELLKSAMANAKRIHQGIDLSTLYISRIYADCGPSLKRYRAASMGRASPILKRTSHLTVELDIGAAKPDAKTKGIQHEAEATHVHKHGKEEKDVKPKIKSKDRAGAKHAKPKEKEKHGA